MKIHSKIKPFVCKICGGRYSRSSTLKIHSYTHLEEKPFKCPYKECNRGFTEKGNLQVHLRTHMKHSTNANEVSSPSPANNSSDKAHTKHTEQVSNFSDNNNTYNFNMNTYNTHMINIYNCIYPFPYQMHSQLQHNYLNQQQLLSDSCCVRNDASNCYVMVPQQNKQTYLQYSMLYRYGLI